MFLLEKELIHREREGLIQICSRLTIRLLLLLLFCLKLKTIRQHRPGLMDEERERIFTLENHKSLLIRQQGQQQKKEKLQKNFPVVREI